MVSIPHRSHQRQRGEGGRDGWREHPSCGELTRGKEHVQDAPRPDPSPLLRANGERGVFHPVLVPNRKISD